ncbi:MAG: hypothetical protein K9L78_04190 [Victivallales bacterium]|nr:hypothetical protein [Victivallales bacterium]
MQNAIESIINEVPNGCIFDTHHVINQLIKRYSDSYLSYANGLSTNNITNILHMEIAKIINEHSNGLIQKVGYSWSETIHGGSGKCACWKKL